MPWWHLKPGDHCIQHSNIGLGIIGGGQGQGQEAVGKLDEESEVMGF